MARHLVQGVDVWLNTPRRPMEASGTSGMKVAFNGGLNLSVLDGWWCEGYKGNNGWAIGNGEVYEDVEYQNEIESRAIYDLLEKEIVPLFYDRGPDGIPRGWVACMKASLQSLCPVFGTDRMVQQYTANFYLPAQQELQRLTADGLAVATDLAAWKGQLQGCQEACTRVLARLRSPGGPALAPHPAYGALPGEEWAQLLYMHVDHHLRQFGH